MVTKKQTITNSRLATYRSCQRKDWFSYEQLRRPIAVSPAMQFGTWIHAGLENWWAFGDVHAASAAAMAAYTKDSGDDPFTSARIIKTMHAYHDQWVGDRVKWGVVAVEQTFSVPILHPITGDEHPRFVLGGKIDGLLHDVNGQHWLLEHKTSIGKVEPGSPYFSRLEMDSQVSAYYLGMADREIVGCLYDVIGKPDIDPLLATPIEKRKFTKAKKGDPSRLYAGQRENDESPWEFEARFNDKIRSGEYFGRAVVVRTESEMDEFAWDLWHYAQMLATSQDSGRWPRNLGSCVSGYGYRCDYYDVCSRKADLGDDAIFRSSRKHEEL